MCHKVGISGNLAIYLYQQRKDSELNASTDRRI